MTSKSSPEITFKIDALEYSEIGSSNRFSPGLFLLILKELQPTG